MEFSEVVRQRRMVRAYATDQSVPREIVDRILDLAVRAPSAGHTQGWRFLVLDDITSCARYWSATIDQQREPDQWLSRIRTAPVLIICLSDKDAYLDRYAEPDKGWTDRSEERWGIPYWYTDTAMAAMIALLAIEDFGLAACFFGVPKQGWDTLRDAFAIPFGLEPVGVISLGYPAPDKRSPSLRRGRRSLADVVAYNSF
jgi:nitroreductase